MTTWQEVLPALRQLWNRGEHWEWTPEHAVVGAQLDSMPDEDDWLRLVREMFLSEEAIRAANYRGCERLQGTTLGDVEAFCSWLQSNDIWREQE